MTRNSLYHLIERSIRKPGLVVPYIRRRWRNRWLHANATNHPEFYRLVMADDVRRKTARGAVGTPSERHWLKIGQLQFDFLVNNGLRPEHQLLEIGCGNLRAGWRFIEWLEPGRYTGVDISPDVLIDATRTVATQSLQDRRPVMMLFDGLDLSFLPADYFDVAHAHSVFTHTPLEVVRSLLSGVHRVLRSGGFFDFTYHQSDTGSVWGFLDEDYYFPTDMLIDLAAEAGFRAAPAEGWSYKQEKIRAVKI